jgi:hypothetical protein
LYTYALGVFIFTIYLKMANEATSANAFRTWIFPSVMSLVSLLIWSMINDIKSDIADVKADIKVLMAQSNIDKTRMIILKDRCIKQVQQAALFLPFKRRNLEQINMLF